MFFQWTFLRIEIAASLKNIISFFFFWKYIFQEIYFTEIQAFFMGLISGSEKENIVFFFQKYSQKL